MRRRIMAVLLDQAKLLTQDVLQRGVIMTMVQTSGVMEKLPFVEVVGSGYAYDIMEELPNVEYRAVNAGYTEGVATISQAVERLVILGGDVDVDVFLAKTHSNINDIRSLHTEAKAKAVARQFEKDFFVGAGTSNAIKGLDKRLSEGIAGTEIKKDFSTAENAEKLDALNELLDAVVDGADCLFMSKKMRREIMKVLQASNHYIENGTDAFGRPVALYGGVEIRPVDDSLIPADKIYAVKFGTDMYVHGLSNGGIQVKDLGELDTKPCYRTRIEAYLGLATKHKKCFAVLNTASEMLLSEPEVAKSRAKK